MALRLLGASTVLDQMKFVCNFAFVKFFSVSTKMYPWSSKKAFGLNSIQKKMPFSYMTATGLEPTTTSFVKEHSTI